jgi:hypothetical protein
MFHTTVLIQQTQHKHPCPWRDFFFFLPVRGFFPFDPILYCLNPFVLHVTLRSMLPSLYNKHNTNIHAPGGIRTHNPSKRTAADPRLRHRGHWDRPPGKQTRYPLYRRLVGPQGRSGRLRKISPPLGFDRRTVQPVASRYTH